MMSVILAILLRVAAALRCYYDITMTEETGYVVNGGALFVEPGTLRLGRSVTI